MSDQQPTFKEGGSGMNAWRGLLGTLSVAAGLGSACAQTPPPLLGSIEAPYAPMQTSLKIAGTTWPAGVAAYGPVGTPLFIHGSDLGGEGTVQFVPYKNGSVDTSVSPVTATITLWTPSILVLIVPSGAMSGLVTVTVEGQTSNGLPFIVTPGTYTGICPSHPSNSQLQITTTSLHDGTVNQAYSAPLNAVGGSGSYTWSIVSGSLPAGLSLSSSGNISGTPTGATGSNPSPITFKVNDTSSPPQTYQADITLAIESQSIVSGVTIYSYNVSYDAANNVTQFKDATYNNGPGIMGTWNITTGTGSNGYDSLNRLSASSITWPDGTQQSMCWDYDAFGNRQHQLLAAGSTGFSNSAGNACQLAGGATLLSSEATPPNANNQISDGLHQYDTAGDLLQDATTGNSYLYDAEGRVCAVASTPVAGYTTMTGYLYNADGTRVAKGTITTMSCDPTANGFQFTENYVLGLADEELTMLDGSNNWQRTNVYAGGKLIGTYDLADNQSGQSVPALHFHLEDALGTRRMQISGMLATLGQPDTDIQSLPYGDALATFPDPYAPPTADDATPLHFTGKERDAESGNDYFKARYFGSSMGRFLSPDPTEFSTFLSDPQSLNRYMYGSNNPLRKVDRNGLWPTDIHNQIIDNAFPGLTAQQRQNLKDVSAHQDSLWSGGQGESKSYQHAMRSDSETVEQAQSEYNKFVSDSETTAAQDQVNFWKQMSPDAEPSGVNGLSSDALSEFGLALHAVADSTSPAHMGFQEWKWYDPMGVWDHHQTEANISKYQMQNAVNTARQAFRRTFGDYWYFMATGCHSWVTTPKVGGGTESTCAD